MDFYSSGFYGYGILYGGGKYIVWYDDWFGRRVVDWINWCLIYCSIGGWLFVYGFGSGSYWIWCWCGVYDVWWKVIDF